MCGLVGMFGDITETDKRMFRMLLIIDVLRGSDSTGVAVVDKNGLYDLFKAIGTPHDMWQAHFDQKTWEDFFVREGNFVDGPNFFAKDCTDNHNHARLLMGHNRAATVGGITADTAHPFVFEKLIGAHNGTLKLSSLKGFKDYDKYDVDSQIMFSEINDKENIIDTWPKIDGALAVTVWHRDSQRLFMARNYQRPLWVIYSNDKKRVMWASEQGMLLHALHRNGSKSQWDKESLKELTPNDLYSYSYDEKEKKVVIHPTKTMKTYWTLASSPVGNGYPNRAAPPKTSGSGASVRTNVVDLDSFRDKVDLKAEPSIYRPTGAQQLTDYSKPFVYDKDHKRYVNMNTGEFRLEYPDIWQNGKGYYKTLEGSSVAPKYFLQPVMDSENNLVGVRYPIRNQDLADLKKSKTEPVYWFSPTFSTKLGGTEHYYGNFDLLLKEGWSRSIPTFSLWYEPSKRQLYSYHYPSVEQFKESLAEYERHLAAKNQYIKDGAEQFSYYGGEMLDAEEMKDVLEGIGGCPHCNRIPPKEVWNQLNWEGPASFDCGAIQCSNYISLCNAEADKDMKKKDVSLHHLPPANKKAV